MPIERKLAAIMFTDIAGYTASMSKSESKSLDLLEKKRRHHIHSAQAISRGNILAKKSKSDTKKVIQNDVHDGVIYNYG